MRLSANGPPECVADCGSVQNAHMAWVEPVARYPVLPEKIKSDILPISTGATGATGSTGQPKILIHFFEMVLIQKKFSR
jgi:hypothetical protein